MDDLKPGPFCGGEAVEDELFRCCLENYHKANKDYIKKQIQIAAEYLTDNQKAELRKKGIDI